MARRRLCGGRRGIMMAFLTMLQAMMAGGGGLDHEGLSKVIPCKRSSGVSCPCSSFVLGFGRFKGKNLEELPRCGEECEYVKNGERLSFVTDPTCSGWLEACQTSPT
eukprot:749707-Hanusia_phi.AAC.2